LKREANNYSEAKAMPTKQHAVTSQVAVMFRNRFLCYTLKRIIFSILCCTVQFTLNT